MDMKLLHFLLACTFLYLINPNKGLGQDSTISVAKKLNLYVFPTKGQKPQKQEDDEIACYKWAKQQTGVDPLSPPKVAPEPVKTGPNGTTVLGAAKGAAAGAAIGAIAGDAGKGAAIGAVSGGIGGLGARRRQDAASKQKAEATAKSKETGLMDNFKKAFSACMEGKGYNVK